MSLKYSQHKAMFAIAKASFKTFLKSPSAIIFSLLFPIVFIVLFGSQRGNQPLLRLVVNDYTQDSLLYSSLEEFNLIEMVKDLTGQEAEADLKKAQLSAIITIKDVEESTQGNLYSIEMITNSIASSNGEIDIIYKYITMVTGKLDAEVYPENKTVAQLNPPTIIEARPYEAIDFILPGQLGFSLISTGIFGVAFSFFFLRKAGVLKRIFATPIRKTYILLGEGLARIFFQMLTVFIIIGFGYFFYDFSLFHGWITVVNMTIVCFLALTVFMGIGFLISNLSNNEQMIPGVTNLVTIPQFLLSGSFFSTSFFPSWLQTISNFLPLTYVNRALRQIAFEGKSLWDINVEIAVLVGFGLIFFTLNTRVFKWQ